MRHLARLRRPLTALLLVLPVLLLTVLQGEITLASKKTDLVPSATDLSTGMLTTQLDIVPLEALPAWTGIGRSFVTWFGGSVAGAGDINGDGYGDVIVGDYRHVDTFNSRDEGAAAVYLGSSNGLPLYPDWTAEGHQLGAKFGYTVATAGDVNGDCYSDILIGVPDYYSLDPPSGGRVVLYLGSPLGLSSNPDWTLDKADDGGLFGIPVGSAGDVNGDGYSDVILGDAGRAEVYLGSATGLSHSADWTVQGSYSTEFVGSSVAAAGDVNGDGFGDVMITTSWRSDEGRPSKVSVYLGSASGLSMTPVWTQTEPTPPGRSPSLSTAGDLNGDGYDDILIGLPYLGGPVVHVHLGSPAGPSVIPDWTLSDDSTNSEFGWSVASAGDVNCDGYDDVIIGAPSYHFNHGRSVVYLGSPSGLTTTPQWAAEGFFQEDLAGWSVASAGDVDGNGADDVVVGAPRSPAGAAYVYLAVTQGCQPPSQRCEPASCDFESLVAKVASLDTTDQVKNGLLRKLNEAKKALDRGDIAVAINKLRDFRAQVAGRAGNAISQADADALDACASQVMDRLQVPPQ